MCKGNPLAQPGTDTLRVSSKSYLMSTQTTVTLPTLLNPSAPQPMFACNTLASAKPLRVAGLLVALSPLFPSLDASFPPRFYPYPASFNSAYGKVHRGSLRRHPVDSFPV